MGQIREVGRSFYDTDIEIEILQEEETADLLHVIMRLYFDNKGFSEERNRQNLLRKNFSKENLSMKARVFFRLFPFHIVFNRTMNIRSIGKGRTHFPI